MTGFEPRTYGERIAEVFDESFVPRDEHSAAGFLANVASGGPALELGIGTGRVALPLKRLGVEVHGIDASPAMIAKLKAKRGGKGIPVKTGNLVDVDPPGGPYNLVYVVFNTFFAPLTQDEQIECFSNVAGHLGPGGLFVIEALVPDLSLYDQGQRTEAFEVTTERVRLDVIRHEAAAQQLFGQHVVITEGRMKLYPFSMRYAWPSELDLMGRLAGMRLRERYGGWHHDPFTAASMQHVSVYELAPRRSRNRGSR